VSSTSPSLSEDSLELELGEVVLLSLNELTDCWALCLVLAVGRVGLGLLPVALFPLPAAFLFRVLNVQLILEDMCFIKIETHFVRQSVSKILTKELVKERAIVLKQVVQMNSTLRNLCRAHNHSVECYLLPLSNAVIAIVSVCCYRRKSKGNLVGIHALYFDVF